MSDNFAKIEVRFNEIFICCDKKLNEVEIKWSEKSLCIVLCSKGYPDNIKKYFSK